MTIKSDIKLQSVLAPSKGPMDADCIACTPPERDELLIAYTEHWKLIAHPWQAHIGSCLLATRQHVGRISELNDEEKKEFFSFSEMLEGGLRKTFAIDLLNYACLMNWAYREANPEPNYRDGKPSPHVHWHIITRYKNPIEFGGMVFEDPEFGEPYDGDRKPNIAQETILLIRDKIRNQSELDYQLSG